MHREQAIIARWVDRLMKRHNLNKAGLGAAAGIEPTTVGRALNPDWSSVSTVKTVVAIAEGVGEPSILDFLESDGGSEKVAPPSEEALAGLLSAILPLQAKGRSTAQSTRVVASALQHGLELLGDQSANPDPGALGVAARGAVARFRDLQQQ